MFVTISIHALLAESDARRDSRQQPAGISIHALLAESDYQRLSSDFRGGYFYPRSPCGERLSFIIYSITDNCISIHALLAESDIELAFLAINPITFLSTLSLRRATPGAKSTTPERYYFYPRSPCGERLFIQNYNAGVGAHFYPRSPCGERRPPGGGLLRSIYFYPRSPCGERQGHPSRIPWRLCISIHALLAESDLAPQVVGVVLVKFLSTLSLRRATLVFTARQAAIGVFLSTLSLRRATVTGSESQKLILHFYPRSPCGERQGGPRPHQGR